MKQAYTRWLPLAASLLLHGPIIQAQTIKSLKAGKAVRPQPAAQFAWPVGAAAVSHALPALGPAAGPQVTQSPLPTPSDLQPATRTVATRAQKLAAGPVSEAWAARYVAPDNSYDAATSTTVDSFGNVYVTGYSFAENTVTNAGDYDYVTIKYSAQGQQQWLARYHGASLSSVSDDVPKSIAVDAAGNVYVTGSSVGTNTSYDYATVKYSSTGQQQWVTRYNSPANSDDLAASVAVDAAGNVLVTGASYNGPSSSYDYVTLQYSASGVQLWEARYSGSGNSDELPTTLALDETGNVYVTGNAYAGNQGDYLTLKYSSTGQQQWEVRYNGPASGYDLARDLAVDAAGNVAVTGTSDDGTGNYDYATVRYSTAGQQFWAMRHNGAGNSYDEATAVALDATGNVLVTGYANTGGGNWDYVTLKYAPNGTKQWENLYNGPDNGYDEAKDVAVDAAGNVAVTGRSFNSSGLSQYATVKYGPNGAALWSARSGGAAGGDEAAMAVAITASDVVVTGTSFAGNRNFDFATVKYGSSGEQVWATRYAGLTTTGIASQATDMAVDNAGNVAVTGRSRSLSGMFVYATIKYSASGQKLWEARFPVVVSIDSNPKVEMDAAGNVYMAGSSNNAFYTIKYEGATGRQLWINSYVGGMLNRGNDVRDLAVDAAGNAYVTGSSVMSITTLNDYATIKYSPGGQQLWVDRYMGTTINSNDVPERLVLDGSGNVYVTGNSGTLKYSADGAQLWSAQDNVELFRDMAVDKAGNVFLMGLTGLKLSPGGQLLWRARYNMNGLATATDAAGNVFVTGSVRSSLGDQDWKTVKADGNTGQPLWEVTYSPSAGSQLPTDLAVDAAGDVYVTGTVPNNLNLANYNTIRYAGASGQVVWQTLTNNPSNPSNQPVSLIVNATGNVYLAGTSFASGSDSDYLTIKYTQTSSAAPAAVLATTQTTPTVPTDQLQQVAVYPNPAVATATVSFRPVVDGTAQVLIYNQLGQQVASLYQGVVRKGQPYEVPLNKEKLAPGVYTCSLLVGGQHASVRLVVTP